MFYMTQVTKTMAIELSLMDDHFLTLVGALGSVCNGLFRIFWGILHDMYGFKTIFGVVVFLQLLVCLTIYTVVQTNRWLYLLAVMVGYGSFGANFIVIPAVIFKMFGLKGGGLMYSVLYVTRALSSIVLIFFPKVLQRNFVDNPEMVFKLMFYAGSFMVFCAATLLFLLF